MRGEGEGAGKGEREKDLIFAVEAHLMCKKYSYYFPFKI